MSGSAASVSSATASSSSSTDIKASDSSSSPNMSSVAEMKAFLRSRNVPHADCVEKRDLVDRVTSTLAAMRIASGASSSAHQPATEARSQGESAPSASADAKACQSDVPAIEPLAPAQLCAKYGFEWSMLPSWVSKEDLEVLQQLHRGDESATRRFALRLSDAVGRYEFEPAARRFVSQLADTAVRLHIAEPFPDAEDSAAAWLDLAQVRGSVALNLARVLGVLERRLQPAREVVERAIRDCKRADIPESAKLATELSLLDALVLACTCSLQLREADALRARIAGLRREAGGPESQQQGRKKTRTIFRELAEQALSLHITGPPVPIPRQETHIQVHDMSTTEFTGLVQRLGSVSMEMMMRTAEALAKGRPELMRRRVTQLFDIVRPLIDRITDATLSIVAGPIVNPVTNAGALHLWQRLPDLAADNVGLIRRAHQIAVAKDMAVDAIGLVEALTAAHEWDEALAVLRADRKQRTDARQPLDHDAAYRDLCISSFLMLHFRCLEALPVLQDLSRFRGPPVDQDNNREVMLSSLGRCLNLLGRGDEAIQPLQEALKLSPRDPAAVLSGLAQAYAWARDDKRSREFEAKARAAIRDRKPSNSTVNADETLEGLDALLQNARNDKRLRPLGNVIVVDDDAPRASRPAHECPLRGGCRRRCAGCGTREGAERKLLHCSRCRVAHYCSKECQAAHWATHKALCQATAERRAKP